MKVLITGAAGFLGQGIVNAFDGKHDLRLLDVVTSESPHEFITGSVADYDTVQRATDGIDGIVIAHMASRGQGVYATPAKPFEINVAGTANVYMAAAEAGIKRVVLISSTGVVQVSRQRGDFLSRDLPTVMLKGNTYALTKILQEQIATQYHAACGIATAILRPSYIMDAPTMADKYGRKSTETNPQYIDRTDIGHAARLALELPDLGLEVFYVLGHYDAPNHADVAYTHDRLGWQPVFDFKGTPQGKG